MHTACKFVQRCSRRIHRHQAHALHNNHAYGFAEGAPCDNLQHPCNPGEYKHFPGFKIPAFCLARNAISGIGSDSIYKETMALYCIGDVQGCDGALERLLDTIGFSASRDTVYLLGDLVNRGPDSAAMLRRCMAAGDAIRCLLGNHDLHLLAAAHGARAPSRRDTLGTVLNAPDAPALLAWLQAQPLARLHDHHGQQLLMVHAGVLPAWSTSDVLGRADEVQAVLRSDALPGFLHAMYGNTPDRWRDDLAGADRLRVIVNALTRLRFCTPGGVMDFESSEAASAAPPGLLPWFDAPGRRTAGTVVAFGHWSTLGWLNRSDVIGLDTGCVWGGCLTAVRFGATLADRERLQVQCEQSQKPG